MFQTPKKRSTQFFSRILSRTKAYCGFAEPGLTWRQRLGIFHANEQRALARLLGSRRPEDACRPPAGPPAA